MKVNGYKAFHKDMRDHTGKQYVEGEIYSIEDLRRFGTEEKGFHFCRRLEDSLRGYPKDEVIIAEVTSLGPVKKDRDEEYDYYDMYYASSLSINRILSREEIILMFLRMEPNDRVERFIKSYQLTEPEIELFRIQMVKNRDVPITTYKADGTKETTKHTPITVKRIEQAISYYQEGNKEAYFEEFPKQKLKS